MTMKPRKLVERLEQSFRVRCTEAHRMELALAAAREAKQSSKRCELFYAVSGDTIAVCIKDHDCYNLMLCTIDMECDLLGDGDRW